ncbi:conserved hypothetical protein [Leishmania braziliensis MHOM/BR/75/M2904]|uniref:Uncharacterized protein n=1 Tax=Leishmania braziliensis TaxID=5660 RepID=A4HB82_LEIBR|nr:conserved hypothetical protein [Leishmania braziliensis MHOM/BR/75/M2904]KAI5686594.1 hypothetical protein MNV84_03235 [Leishmania braziliensis]CAJ2471639.1 unnamed protein product [Leishmania braziliensis]CAM38668.1 conserved hypothetical protein [Leishmania braziliensis MHOM/BR/75/M2904]
MANTLIRITQFCYLPCCTRSLSLSALQFFCLLALPVSCHTRLTGRTSCLSHSHLITMFSMTKFILATAITVAAVAFPGAAMEFAMAETTTMTAAPVPVNLSLNIVTTVLLLGVSIAVALIYALWKVLPKIRSGELSFSKIDFDWRAELLNQTPKKEKARFAAEKARRAAEMAHREEEMAANRYCGPDEREVPYGSTQPRVELGEVDTLVARSHHEGRKHGENDESVAVTVPRE